MVILINYHRHPRENEDWTLVQVPVSVSWCAPARRYIRELIQREIKQTMKITSVFGPHTPTYPQEHFHHCTDYDGDTSEIEV